MPNDKSAKTTMDLVTKIDWLVVHKLIKAQNTPSSVETRDALNPINTNVERLLNRLYESYRKRTKKSYGRFSDETGEDNLRRQLDAAPLDLVRALPFSVAAMGIYDARISSANLATGGYTLFSSFSTTSTNYLGIFVLSDHQQFLINSENMEVNDTTTIDMSNIHLACLLNMDLYNRSIEAPDNDDKYLSFVSRRDAISDYFRSFIGCTALTNAKANSDKLRAIIGRFMDTQEIDEGERRRRETQLGTHISASLLQGDLVSLSSISTLLSDPEDPLEFINYLAEHEGDHGLDDEVALDGNRMKYLQLARLKFDGFELQFRKDLIDTGRVVLDHGAHQIHINDVSDEELDRLS